MRSVNQPPREAEVFDDEFEEHQFDPTNGIEEDTWDYMQEYEYNEFELNYEHEQQQE